MPPDRTTSTCDPCRGRKIKCLPLEAADGVEDNGKCKRCDRIGLECTFNYRAKKSGRPPKVSEGSNSQRPTSHQQSAPPGQPQRTSHISFLSRSGSTSHGLSNNSFTPGTSSAVNSSDVAVALSMVGLAGSANGGSSEVYGSSRTPTRQSAFDYTLPGNSTSHSNNIWNSFDAGDMTQGNPTNFIAEILPDNHSSSTSYANFSTVNSQPQPVQDRGVNNVTWHPDLPTFPLTTRNEEELYIQNIENITSWSNISFFLNLYMSYLHAILPLVHKPSFARDIVTRRDKKSESFRGLLCSIVSYVICQLPKSKMINEFSQVELETLIAKTRVTSRAIQVKQHNEPNMVMLVSTIADYNTTLATGRLNLAAALLAEASRYAYLFGLHRPNPTKGLSTHGPQEEYDHVEVEINRRIYWQLYNCDKTESSRGNSPILMNDFEGVPPFPLEIDDEYITAQGHLPQPANRTAHLTGFVVLAKLFQVLYGCLFRQRSYNTSQQNEASQAEMLSWIQDAENRINTILASVPQVLRPNTGERMTVSRDEADVFGTQQANIWVSSVWIKFALLDFKANVRPEDSIKLERNAAGVQAYQLLSNTPIEHLAANGESMRGKVLRIVLALLDATNGEQDSYTQNVFDWWTMYSQVQFVQVIPMDVDVVRPSRAASPVQ